MNTALPAPPPPLPSARAGKRKYKKRAATVAKREIARAQKATHRVVPAKAMERLVREIASAATTQQLRFGADALSALHEAAESFVIEVMQGASANAATNDRLTIMQADLAVGLKVVT